ncbi:PTI1-like tyrosine-protein kinase 3 [Rutidosis leptorrhynchoides]|uniref:PTI1-like tyrosine-protein kinase 3 n=1 Tax=Rutidosis leptorrhynchoides TaxID=125765 RepID=UPI003A994E35
MGSRPDIRGLVVQHNLGLQKDKAPQPDAQKALGPTTEVPALSLDELKEKTNNFGRGSNGVTYFVTLNDGTSLSVKKRDFSDVLNPLFLTQVSRVSTLKHENFVGLRGYYCEGNAHVLAYEYATMGSLHDRLHGTIRKGVREAKPEPVLDWMQRVRIAIDAAKGLEYLHEKVNPCIIHGKIRSNNVLLFKDLRAKIGDLNLSHRARNLNVLYRSMGSSPYHAPEYALVGRPTCKTDVYSFGVVLLELLTGRKPGADRNVPNIATWATPKQKKEDEVEKIVDPSLKGEYSLKGAVKLAAVANLCLQNEPGFRPCMTLVVKGLEPLLGAEYRIPPMSLEPDINKHQRTS